jgi:NAD(P)-dependent dehydrogenase (short-subunit alcohol dehydrogenase family)
VVVVADLADLADPAGPAAAAGAALDALGSVDILVNNAAAGIRLPTLELDAALIDSLHAVNVRAPLLLIAALLPSMLEHGAGAIINLSSVSGVVGTPRRAAYAATKGAVDAFTRSLAMEFGPQGIRVNSVAPGVVDTDLWARNKSARRARERTLQVRPGPTCVPESRQSRLRNAGWTGGRRTARKCRRRAAAPAPRRRGVVEAWGGAAVGSVAVIDRRVADLVVVGHLAYLAFIPVGVLLVARRPHLAPLHLAAVAVALASVTVGFDCPLTTWEQTLRRRGGQHPDPGGFVNHYVTGGAFPHGADHVAQIAVAVLIAAAYLRLAHRSRTRRRTSASV